jgi:microcystin degradation protein MlrC
MSVAIASIIQESNTFSPVVSRYEDLSPVFGPGVLERHRGKLTETGGFIDVLTKARKRIVPVCAAWAVSAGRMVRQDVDRLAEEFSTTLAAAGKVEGLLLALHGAQTAEGVDDVEGLMLGRARNILGQDVPIVLTLDLHANITRAMMEHATAIVGYQTFPHVDMYETGQKASRLMLKILSGKVRSVMAWRKLPLIVNAENQQTSRGPAHRLMARAQRYERKGKAEAISIFFVQPWLDIEEMGAAVVVVTNDRAREGDRIAASLAQKLWDTRHEFEVKLTPVKEAIRLATATKGSPVVFSESADSTGSGSPGDSTGVLKHLLNSRLSGPAAIFLVDPEAVAKLQEAGVGATVTLAIGGKLDPQHSQPVTVTGRVHLISDGRWTSRGRGYNTGIENCMGTSVVLEVGLVHILIAERSAMTVDPALYRSHGMEPLHYKIVVVKSPNGFRAEYEPIAARIFVVDTPGVSTAKLQSLPWQRVGRPIYPLDKEISYKAQDLFLNMSRPTSGAHLG